MAEATISAKLWKTLLNQIYRKNERFFFFYLPSGHRYRKDVPTTFAL